MRGAIVCTLLVVLLVAAPSAVAQTEPPATPLGLPGFIADPGRFMTDLFNTMLIGLGRHTTTDAVQFMNWVMGNSNVITQTPPALSYDSDVVRRLSAWLRLAGNTALAVISVIGGLNMIVNPHIRAPYHGALELVPRVLLGGLLVNTSLDWGRFVIDLNNALCQGIGASSMPGWGGVLQPGTNAQLLDLIAVVVYLIMGLLLLVQMLMRLALVDVLLILAPLALLCWVLPQTYSWARLWFQTFFAAVFVQFIQVLVLQVGTELIQRLPSLLPGPLSGQSSQPFDGGRAWLVTLLLGVAVLQLARSIPRLLPGYPGGGVAVGGLPISGRRVLGMLTRGRTG